MFATFAPRERRSTTFCGRDNPPNLTLETRHGIAYIFGIANGSRRPGHHLIGTLPGPDDLDQANPHQTYKSPKGAGLLRLPERTPRLDRTGEDRRVFLGHHQRQVQRQPRQRLSPYEGARQ